MVRVGNVLGTFPGLNAAKPIAGRANNVANVATAVLDRLEVIEMPFYSDEQKVVIAKDYLLPQATKDAGLPSGSIVVDPNLWMEIVRPL
ncbi:MAG: hypothetical protein HYS98_08580, partial [Deltaproteobacteria bacterium]|nr:hypothetical protein [Deltaproteobacteria bacterium]